MCQGENALLPLIHSKVYTLDMQCHIMKLNIETVEALNSGQAPVDTSDCPIFVLLKKITYCFPNQFSYYFAMFGGLHIEQCLLRVHSQLIENNTSNKII